VLEHTKLKERLMSLNKAKTDLDLMLDSAQNELKRRLREKEELTEMMGRQLKQLKKLCNKRIKIVSLKEYKTLRLVLRMNEANYVGVIDLINKAKVTIKSHNVRLNEVKQGISNLEQQLENTPEMAQVLPFRRAL